jgi:hypothetical protein
VRRQSIHEAIEFGGVVADDLAAGSFRQMAELAPDVLLRIGPDAVGVREVRALRDVVRAEANIARPKTALCRSRALERAGRALMKPQEPDSRTFCKSATNGSLARRRVLDVFDEAKTIEQRRHAAIRAPL